MGSSSHPVLEDTSLLRGTRTPNLVTWGQRVVNDQMGVHEAFIADEMEMLQHLLAGGRGSYDLLMSSVSYLPAMEAILGEAHRLFIPKRQRYFYDSMRYCELWWGPYFTNSLN